MLKRARVGREMAKKQKKKSSSGDVESPAGKTKSKSKSSKSSDGEEKVDAWTEHSAKKQRKLQKQKKKLEQQEQQRREEELLQAPQMSLPLNLNNPPVMQNPMEGPAFLDTIPEDTSIAAGAGVIHRPALSTASAVASADSDDEEQAKSNKKSGSDLSNGATLGGDDAAARKRKAKKLARKKTQNLMFYTLVGVLLVGVAIGIFFLLQFSKSHQKNQVPSPAPADNYTLSPGSVWLESEAPTSVPVWDAQDIQELDDALLEITPEQRSFSNLGTPQATCRDWFLTGSVFHSNFTVQLMGKERVQQRYILCVLYHSAGGQFWDTTRFTKSTNYLDAYADECTWDGVICPPDSATVSGIYLENANLIGELPEELAHMKHITYLRIFDNAGLVGTIPSNLLSKSSLPKLVTLDLRNNSLTGTIPEPSSVSDELKNVFLHDNNLIGRIPFLGSNLKRLYAFNNMLTEFPSDQYATIKSLQVVLIDNNFLTGTLSQTKWETQDLEVLDVAGNSLVGRVPESLWQLTSLKNLILNDNQFRDTLPASETTGKAFENVWLHSNEFAGTIPASLGVGWVNLTSLRLHDNNFSGAIPCNNFFAVDPATFQLEADCALPSLACTCCTCYPN